MEYQFDSAFIIQSHLFTQQILTIIINQFAFVPGWFKGCVILDKGFPCDSSLFAYLKKKTVNNPHILTTPHFMSF